MKMINDIFKYFLMGLIITISIEIIGLIYMLIFAYFNVDISVTILNIISEILSLITWMIMTYIYLKKCEIKEKNNFLLFFLPAFVVILDIFQILQ